jgi:hypothetical protein
MNELELLFGTTDVNAIIAKKTTKKDAIHTLAVSKKPKTVDMTVPECKTLCTKSGIEYQDGYENRVLEYKITNETVDRYGDIVRAQGGDWSNYKKNPVINFAHDNSTFPVGNTIKLWHDKENKSWMAWGLFMDERVDSTGRADTIFKMAKSGFMRACSIGFVPKEYKRPTTEEKATLGMPEHGIEYVKWEGIEWSPCSVQANPDALQNSMELKSFNIKNIDVIRKDKLFADKDLEQVLKTIEELSTNTVLNCQACSTLIIQGENFNYMTCPACKCFIDNTGKVIDKDITLLEKINIVLRPYPNEHACRLVEPSTLSDECRRKNDAQKHNGKGYDVIYCKKSDSDSWVEQAFRYDKTKWTSSEASAHCKSHDGKFEAAKEEAMNQLADIIIQYVERSNSVMIDFKTEIDKLIESNKNVNLILEQTLKSLNRFVDDVKDGTHSDKDLEENQRQKMQDVLNVLESMKK